MPSRWTPTCARAPRIGRAAEGHPARAVDANDQEARRLLGEVYEGSDDGGCALTAVEGRLHLNLSCPRVHADLCTALGELADAFTRVPDPERARRAEEAARRSGCVSPTR